MNLKTLGLVGLLIVSCNRPTTTENEIKTNDTVEKSADDSMDGYWTDGSGPNASIVIADDSIRDVEHNTWTKFDLDGDSVALHHPDEIVKAKMYKTHADTLVYEFSGAKTKYWRFND